MGASQILGGDEVSLAAALYCNSRGEMLNHREHRGHREKARQLKEKGA
jgi:hypothetical protein